MLRFSIQTAVVIGALVLGAAACRDTTPLMEDADFSVDAGADSALTPGCVQCLQQACPDLLQACLDTEPCLPMINCSTALGCGRLGRDQGVLCSIPCALEFGITSVADPSAVALTELGDCLFLECPGADQCGGVPGGAGGAGGSSP
jgi:hypothetical protein